MNRNIKSLEDRISKIRADIDKDEAFFILSNQGRLSERLSRLRHVEIPLATEYNDQKRVDEFIALEQATISELKEYAPKLALITKEIFIKDELIINKSEFQNNIKVIANESKTKERENVSEISNLTASIIEKKLTDDFQVKILQLKNQISLIDSKEQQRKKIQELLKEVKDYSSLIDNLTVQLKGDQEILTAHADKLGQLHPQYEKYETLTSEIEQLKEDLTNLREIVAKEAESVRYLTSEIMKIKEIKEQIKNKELELKLKNLKTDNEIHSILRKEIFHANGIPKFALEKILPLVSIRASRIITELTEGRLHQIIFKPLEANRVGFEIFVNDGGQDQVSDSFSGGEKTLINASIRFAIMERIAEIPDTAGAIFRKSNTLFIDEGDLGTLDDESTRQRFVDKILELKSSFKKIILITHLEDVAEQFSERIKIGIDEQTGNSKIY